MSMFKSKFMAIAPLLLLALWVASAAGKSAPTQAPQERAAHDVYLAGSAVNAAGERVAMLWKNGCAQPLELGPGAADSEAKSVFASGADVYAMGRQGEKWVIWKNGTQMPPLETKKNRAFELFSLFVSDGDVYVAGNMTISKVPVKRFTTKYGSNVTQTTAVVWKNGKAAPLQSYSTAISAGCLFVSGGDVYVSGGVGALATELEMRDRSWNYNAAMWKNGKLQMVGDWRHSTFVDSIHGSGQDVLALVSDSTQGLLLLWVNAKKAMVISRSYVSHPSVFACGDDVYVAGAEILEWPSLTAPRHAMLWKNGQPISLGIDSRYAPRQVAVAGGDVYLLCLEIEERTIVEGDIWKGGVIWKNGQVQMLMDEQDLKDKGYSQAHVWRMFVK